MEKNSMLELLQEKESKIRSILVTSPLTKFERDCLINLRKNTQIQIEKRKKDINEKIMKIGSELI